MTNMEALDMPAASGVDSTAIILGDYSNGNDAVLVRNGLSFSQLPGKSLTLVSGPSSRDKIVELQGIDAMEAERRLARSR